MIPVGDCQSVEDCVAASCRKCGGPLAGVDPEPLRHQVWELPEIHPVVTEYRRHRLVCPCGVSTCGGLPPGVPTGQAGPRPPGRLTVVTMVLGAHQITMRESDLTNIWC